MHTLPIHRQVQVVSLLTEGVSERGIARLTGIHRDTIRRLNLLLGSACGRLHDATFRDLHIPFVQIDETWSFIHTKQHRLSDTMPSDRGDCYLWLALDPQSKVVLSYRIGKRVAEEAKALLRDLRSRILNRPQITTDGYRGYVDAVEDAFGTDVHYAMLVKDADFLKQVHQGEPDLSQVSTSLIERCNLTIRMQMRRHARRTNAHSKTWAHHQAAVALHLAFYHWCRVHETLRVTPAMELGVTQHIWSVEELIGQAQAAQVPAPQPPVRTRPRLRLIQGGKHR